jgi:FkbM family methyltransferase
VLDLGAHIESFTAYVSTLATSAKIVSYEPEPSNFSLLARNMAANNLLPRVRIKNEAVFGKEGQVELQVGVDSIGHSILVPQKSNHGESRQLGHSIQGE